MYAPPPEPSDATSSAWHSCVSCVGFLLRLCCCVNQEHDLSLGESHGSRANLLDSRDRRLLSSNEAGNIETTFTPPRSPQLEHRTVKGGSTQTAPQGQQPLQQLQQRQQGGAAGGPASGSHRPCSSGGSPAAASAGKGGETSPLKGGIRSKSHSRLSLLDDDDICPTCLEPYTEENPKVLTKCGHHYHLPCIYEWLERSETCPMCGREMHFEEIL
ncbi:hypothetical protein N2152v2_010150 [Parachlorella kessleri]